jgi:hypothetical protein
MSIDIVPIGKAHIEGFHAALDAIARERAYLAFLEAPPIEETRASVARNIARGAGVSHDLIVMALLFDAAPAVSDPEGRCKRPSRS